jgi:hypothetical protein
MKIQAKIFTIATILITNHFAQAQSINITGISTTDSRCEQSGTLTVAASGGTGVSANYRFEIIAPECCTRPIQDAPEFASLAPNTYTVVAKDVVNNTADTAIATVSGNYSIMNPTATVDNSSCATDGASITINVANGRPPYSYEITQPVSEATGIVSSNVFTGLNYGVTYTYRVWDSCGNFQTRTITPTTSDFGAFTLSKNCLTRLSCDSFSINYYLTVNSPQTHRYPYIFEFLHPDGSFQLDTISSGPTTGTITITFSFAGDATSAFGVTATNACGTSNSSESITTLSDYLSMFAVATPLCGGINQYKLDEFDNADPSACNKPHGETVTYSLYDPSGVLIATQVNNSTFSGATIPGGANYKVVRSTECGADSIIFNWSSTPPALNIESHDVTRNTCKDNTANVRFIVRNAIGAVKVILTSGPSSVTFDDGSTYTYTYPDTINNYSNNQFINFLGAGLYNFTVVDACGQSVSRSISISPAHTRSSNATFTQTDGCINSNRINWSVTGNSTANQGVISINPGGYNYSIYTLPASGSAGSLPSGTYYCTYAYTPGTSSNRYLKDMASLGCDTIKDTIDIDPYENPIFYGPSVTHCNNTNAEILLIPDLNKGVAPFSYEIISGPVTRPAQSSPFFTNLPYGTYTFRMSDACGNSFTANKEIEEITAIAFETSGNTCENGEAMFGVPHSPYITYNWTRPNGSTFQGDTLIVSPVTAADTGTYQIEMWVDVAGCKDTIIFSQQLSEFCGSMTLPVTFTSFYGKIVEDKTVLTWQTAREQQNMGFEIERSADGRIWNKIGFVASKSINGTSNAALNYNYTDTKPLSGRNIYRLKQMDNNGEYHYSQQVVVSFAQASTIVVYPNPAKETLTIEGAGKSAIVLYDILGQKIEVPQIRHGNKTIINVALIPAGNYMLQITNGAQSQTQKIVINH